MAQIKKGTVVRAHLDPLYRGTVLEVVSEKPPGESVGGPMSYETYCIVKLDTGTVVKTKITDLFIEY
tara:strand:+ start:1102 stop:1302 length:201 start_codon:yes stop_codon:yes gene_type:complete